MIRNRKTHLESRLQKEQKEHNIFKKEDLEEKLIQARKNRVKKRETKPKRVLTNSVFAMSKMDLFIQTACNYNKHLKSHFEKLSIEGNLIAILQHIHPEERKDWFTFVGISGVPNKFSFSINQQKFN